MKLDLKTNNTIEGYIIVYVNQETDEYSLK